MDSWKKQRILKYAEKMSKPVDLEELSRISGEPEDKIKGVLGGQTAKKMAKNGFH